MSAAIEVSELRRRYGGSTGFEAVRGISFEVARGELFALLGTNGAGKTSSLEVIEGLSPADGGTVRVLGGDPLRERAELRPKLGIMLQQGGFPSDLTVSEVARMWGGTLTSPRPVPEVLEMVALSRRAGVAVKALSGGERRRLDLAMALMGRPTVLFLDEPTTGLDPESRRNAWRLIRDVLVDGVTVLLTTHYLEEAEQLADRLAIMHQGEIVAGGTVAEVVADHPARIRYELPPGGAPPHSPQDSCVVEGGWVVTRTHTLQRSLTSLLGWAERTGTELRGLTATSASLETAFLALAETDVEPEPELQEAIR